jgi:hypothetical protein
MIGTDDVWYVKLPTGVVHRVTLDQLDEAFQAGYIDQRTQVREQDASRWMTLGEILGDDESEPPPAHAEPPRPPHGYVPQTPHSLRPMSVDFEDVDVDLTPFKRRSGAGWAFALAIAAAIGGVAIVRPDLRASVLSQVESRIPQIESRIRRMSDGKWQTVAAATPGPVEGPQAASATTPATVAALPPAAPPPVQQAAASPAPAAAAAPPSSVPAPTASSLAPRFAPQRKSQPLQTPRRPKQNGASHAKSPSGHGSAAGSKPGSETFTTGGNKFDPLNSSI